MMKEAKALKTGLAPLEKFGCSRGRNHINAILTEVKSGILFSDREINGFCSLMQKMFNWGKWPTISRSLILVNCNKRALCVAIYYFLHVYQTGRSKGLRYFASGSMAECSSRPLPSTPPAGSAGCPRSGAGRSFRWKWRYGRRWPLVDLHRWCSTWLR